MSSFIFMLPSAAILVLAIVVIVSILKKANRTGSTGNSIDTSDQYQSVQNTPYTPYTPYIRNTDMPRIIKPLVGIVTAIIILTFAYFASQLFLSPRVQVHDPQKTSYLLQPISQNVYVNCYKVWVQSKHDSGYDHHVKFIFNGEAYDEFSSECSINYQNANESPSVTVKKYAYSNPILNALFPPYESYDIYANESQIYNTDNQNTSGNGT